MATDIEKLGGITDCGDGTVMIVRRFRITKEAVDKFGREGHGDGMTESERDKDDSVPVTEAPLPSSSQPATPHAEDADPSDVKTEFLDCKAKDPMFCPYHGAAAIKANILEGVKKELTNSVLFGEIANVGVEVTKENGVYTVKATCPKDVKHLVLPAVYFATHKPGFTAVDAKLDTEDGKFVAHTQFKGDVLDPDMISAAGEEAALNHGPDAPPTDEESGLWHLKEAAEDLLEKQNLLKNLEAGKLDGISLDADTLTALKAALEKEKQDLIDKVNHIGDESSSEDNDKSEDELDGNAGEETPGEEKESDFDDGPVILKMPGDKETEDAGDGKEHPILTGKNKPFYAQDPVPGSVVNGFVYDEDGLPVIVRRKGIPHVPSKFPQNVTQDMLEKAIEESKAKGIESKGHGGLGTREVEIDGRRYYLKREAGWGANVIRNGRDCDMAYRAAGILAPDSELYQFGDTVYRLAEAIEGEVLGDFLKHATDAQKSAVNEELLKGYPLDALFSNWDVLGSGLDNVIVDKDGRCWRIDNDGAFALRATGGEKTSAYANGLDKRMEHYDKWAEREWIDDYRTMRMNPENKSTFGAFRTSDIFLSATKLDFDAAVKDLPEETRTALERPLKNMKFMTNMAVQALVARYTNATQIKTDTGTVEIDPLSIMLDGIYDASKDGARSALSGGISWSDMSLVLKGGEKTYESQHPKPTPPSCIPTEGENLAKTVIAMAHSINYHIKQGDYVPNPDTITAFNAMMPKLEGLAGKGAPNAAELMEIAQKCKASLEGGSKTSIPLDVAEQTKHAAKLHLPANYEEIESAKAAHASELADYNKKVAEWEEGKKTFNASAAGVFGFKDFEDGFIGKNYDTNGIERGGLDGFSSEHSRDAQKVDSWDCSVEGREDDSRIASCQKRVRQMLMMGVPLAKIHGMADGGKIFNGKNGGLGHKGKFDGKRKMKLAVESYLKDPTKLKKELSEYAKHKAMMILAMSQMKNPYIDNRRGLIWTVRREHKGLKLMDGFNKAYGTDASSSAGFMSDGCLGDENLCVGRLMPTARTTDLFMLYKGDGEQEICCNNIDNPFMPFKYSTAHTSWNHVYAHYVQDQKVKKLMDKMEGMLWDVQF